MNKNQSLTNGEVLPTLLKFTIPILLTILLQTAYGTADLLIVGQFSDVANVSGVTIGSQIMQAITSFFLGISMGSTILSARYIGSGESDKATKVVGASIVIFTILAAITSICVVGFNDYIARIMKTPVESFEYAKSYLIVCGCGIFFIVFYNLLGSIFRGIGDSKTPLLTVFIACITNIVLDLILVAVFDLGATGAAFATVIAQGVSVVSSLFIIKHRKLPFSFTKSDIKLNYDYAKNVVRLGLPVAIQGTLVTVSFLVITSIVNVFGVEASAAVGIVEKITGLIMVVPIAFMQSLAAFTAQNLGANMGHRARLALMYGMAISLVFGCITAYLSAFHGTIFTQIFTSDVSTTVCALEYLKSYSIDCVLVAIMFSFSGYFNGCGNTRFVMLHSVLSAFCIRIPLAHLLSSLENTSLFLIGLATPSSTAVQIIVCIIFFIYQLKNIKKDEIYL